MDPTTMDLDQIRDWAARRLPECEGWTDAFFREMDVIDRHPIPATLDAIAGLMPENYWWLRVDLSWGETFWIAGPVGVGLYTIKIPDTGDEILDRARLYMLATLAEDKDKEPRP
jgi:hypothetical protein